MSTANNPSDSTLIQPLHNPAKAARVIVPTAPLGDVVNQPAELRAKALLERQMAKSLNPTYISPTDNLMTPCTEKLTTAKKKNFTKSGKSIQLLAFNANEWADKDDDEANRHPDAQPQEAPAMEVDEENPF
ncbi:hypothetical protein R3P38DRAFT_3312212 [Favolaschia claudopus]|uniref:Uncharacterized protein n=1 Tax=Favolaschia claudopus TaxID=2862362 RepID=A0AAW0C8B8_9AGAR